MDRIFEIDDLIKVAKRENNNKRSYLYVNPIQGKHVPVSPSLSMKLFEQMARKLESRYIGKKILVIGFAETATAIGSMVAYEANNVKYHMNTTREDIAGAEYLIFTESHSHATEQRLVKNCLQETIENIDCIIFVEDEVTTGNTIEKLINVIRGEFDCSRCQFGIISILNSMTEERLNQLSNKKIICDFIKKVPSQYRIGEINQFKYKLLETEIKNNFQNSYNQICIGNYWNSRVVTEISVLKERVESFVTETLANIAWCEEPEKVLVLGTEEFMFPAMLIGKKLEEKYRNAEVKFHATTRSPIEVSDGDSYPLHERKPLISLYEAERYTFIYNLQRYDQVIVVTDSGKINETGIFSLLAALEEAGNTNITVVQWRDER